MKTNLDFDPRGLSREDVIKAYWDLQSDYITLDVKYEEQMEKVAEVTTNVEHYLRKAFRKDDSISKEKANRMLSYLSNMRKQLGK